LIRQTGIHVAIIMDGNGRWAQSRGLPRHAGHRAGAAAVRRVVEDAPTLGISTLSLFAFSSDNWKRPAPEVNTLMHLLERFLRTEVATCVEKGVRIEIIGRRDRLSERLANAMDAAERSTACGTVLRLRIAVDYSSRDAIVQAASCGATSREELEKNLPQSCLNVDLLVRTGGEKRLSDFLLWESAYAELYFTDVRWPDFDGDALRAAVNEFALRQRRFGALPGDARPARVAS
jgi:undecaprenyl diphosphate synthase